MYIQELFLKKCCNFNKSFFVFRKKSVLIEDTFFNPMIGSLSFSKKFQHVLKLPIFILDTKNTRRVSHAFYGGTYQMFEHTIFQNFLKMSSMTKKFKCVLKPEKFTFCTKFNHCILHKFQRKASSISSFNQLLFP